jgi:SAM-dependent methyltransferase
MERVVQPELLDELPADDPRAVRSRRDLRRVNAWMGNAATLARALQEAFPTRAPRRLVEIGAGDGQFLLGIARNLFRRAGRGNDCSAVLVDRQALLPAATQEHFTTFNWRVRAVKADVFDYFENGAETADAIIANLFLHHFPDEQLKNLFRLAHKKARVLIAVEPRRSHTALFCSRLLWLIGCNAVTRHDAVVSVRAGFAGRELSTLWPDPEPARLIERSAGLFSHLFVVRREI